MGPEGGDEGGYVMGTGTPEEIVATPGSVTGDFLRPLLPEPAAARRGRRARLATAA
jgi:excinuclease ABC subunit A